MFNPNNTSQDPEFEGPTGHEKRIHKTHFEVPDIKFRDTGKGTHEWVEVAPGRWKRVRKRIASSEDER